MSMILPFKTALTIAGSDSSGGAGIQADLKTFQANMVFGMSVITAVTVQNTKGVTNVQNIDPEIVRGQIEDLFEDIKIDAVKIGMLSSCGIIEAVKEGLSDKNVEF
ncbi:MAG: hydroxymethylpyrimidine/phosphomethylpyrimidine kinase, partial [Desulfobacteraceae bacterium]